MNLRSAPVVLPWHRSAQPADAHMDGTQVAAARERFFGEGIAPSGQVAEPVWLSWQRCLHAGLQPERAPEFQPVSRSKVNYLAARDHVLLRAAQQPFDELQAAVARSHCKVLLTDRDGILLRVTPASRGDGPVSLAACRVGVDLGELVVGTTAPTVAGRHGGPCAMGAHEHFYEALREVRCVAAPIRNRHGGVVAVLDLTIEGQPFGFDAQWLVQAYAATIENNLRIAQTRQQLLLRLHSMPQALAGGPVGLVAVDDGGRITWLNALAGALLGASASEARQLSAAALLGCTVDQLLARTLARGPQSLLLPNGLTVWMLAEYRPLGGADNADSADDLSPVPAPTAASPAATPATDAAATLAALSRQLIEQTLAACDGNVSRAARQLGVSRGLLYRRLRDG